LGGCDLGGGYGGVYSLVFPVHGKPKTLCYFLFPSNPGLLNIEDSVGIDLLWFCVYGFVGSPRFPILCWISLLISHYSVIGILSSMNPRRRLGL
jgi:hypothetical protein